MYVEKAFPSCFQREKGPRIVLKGQTTTGPPVISLYLWQCACLQLAILTTLSVASKNMENYAVPTPRKG